MSRFTASPFHKPSAFEFPRAPPSPPETHSDTIGAGIHISPATHGIQDYGLNDTGVASASPDAAGSRFRRTSSIQYHNAGIRDNKDRVSNRNAKSLIIVVPPPTLIQYDQHGTLSNGPFHRLSQGVVMPLFPSMFGQLTAIAREFNFPSTSGLCLYFHYIEDGITIKPRISDDSWQTLWAYLSEPSISNERRPLISGKVEFDVDLRLARWYSSWISTIQREFSDHPSHYHPSAAPSLAHFRGESRTTVGDGRPFEEDVGENSFIQQHSAPIARHVPRKLSLVERFDISSDRPEIRTHPLSAASPPDVPRSGSQVLATIVQEDEPKTARQDLDNRVKSWRASALITPTPLAASGQTSLDPPYLPNNMPIDVPSSPISEEELKLEDFTWSISSAGPQSCGDISPVSWSRVSSVHLAGRLEGSVCSTPSNHTSFGPSDYDPLSPALSFARIATPDIARRFFESIPSTPGTATTWGAPLSYPPSPRCQSPTPSVDLGERLMLDELECPIHRYPRPMSEEAPGPSKESIGWNHLNASVVIDKGNGAETNNLPSTFGYPYLSIYESVYPHFDIYPGIPGAVEDPSSLVWGSDKATAVAFNLGIKVPAEYPTIDIYSAVYPYNLTSIYPPLTRSLEKVHSQEGYPYFNLYPPTRPPFYAHLSVYMCDPDSQYPIFQIYREILQHDTVSSSKREAMVSAPWNTEDFSQSVHLRAYPTLNLYPAVYPFFDIYPAVEKEAKNVSTVPVTPGSSLKMATGSGYPSFNLYPALYPNFNLYPPPYYEATGKVTRLTPHEDSGRALKVAVPPSYPSFNLYPSLYPYLSIYPASYFSRVPHDDNGQTQGSPYPEDASRSKVQPSVKPEAQYPFFNLYPAVYPYFDLYLPKLEAPLIPVHPTKARAKSTSRLTHSELHAMVMMERISSTGSFGHTEFEQGSRTSRKNSYSPIDSSSEYIKGHSSPVTGAIKNIGLPSASTQIGDLRRPSMAFRSGSFLQGMEQHQQPGSSLTRKPSSLREREISRSPSALAARQVPRRRDSIVLQRVKAFDTNAETTSILPKETLSRFPMPPKAPLPSTPLDRRNIDRHRI